MHRRTDRRQALAAWFDTRGWAALATLAALTLGMGTASAHPTEHDAAAHGPRHGPPPEALAACKALAAGTACSVTLAATVHQGSCWAPPGMPLACRPTGAPAPAAHGSKPAPAGKSPA